MDNQEHSTTSLMNVLQSADFMDIDSYSKNYIRSAISSFSVYMDSIIKRKGLKRQDIFQKADIPQKYGYKLLSGESHTKDRDKLLRIFFATNMTLKEVRRALELYGMPVLYPKKKRDALLIIAFNRGISSVDEVNKILTENGESELTFSNR